MIQVDKYDKHLIGVDGDADVLELLDEERGAGLGATTETKRKWFSQELEKWENKAVLSLCLVKRKLLEEYDTYK